MGMATPRVGLGGQRRQLAAADRQLLTQINSPTFEELQMFWLLGRGPLERLRKIGREEIVLLTEVRGRKLISQREMSSIKRKGLLSLELKNMVEAREKMTETGSKS